MQRKIFDNNKFKKLIDLGNFYLNKKNILKAIKEYKKILLMDKNNEIAINNLSYCYMLNNDFKKSETYIKKAIKINPNNGFLYFNSGNLYKRLGKLDLALKSYNKAILLDPKNINFKFNKSYILLKKKLYEKGWKLYENRILAEYKNDKIYNLIKNNLYLKKNLPKKQKIIIVPEQGIGDHVLFSSMYKEIINYNPDCKIIVNKRLKNIFKRSFKSANFIDEVNLKKISQYTKENYSFIYAGSLGRFIRNKISDFTGEPFLIPNEKKVKKYKSILSKYNYKKFIGISWKSTATKVGEKSLSLSNLKKIFSNKKIGVVNLQYGNNDDLDKFNLTNNKRIINIKNLDLYNEIDDVISLISCLDLVVTTPNVNVHFSGSIAKKCIVLSPIYNELFLYTGNNKGKCEWYKNQKTFIIKNNLNKVLKEVGNYLRKI